MSLALIFAGILLLVASARNQQDTLFTLVKGDLTGQNNFVEWILALMIVGSIGYIPKLRPLSVSLLALILITIFLKKGQGFFAQLTTAVGKTTLFSSSKSKG